MAGANLKYRAGTYTAKINKLEGYYTDLSNHLSNLKSLREEVWDFWNDTQTQSYLDTLDDAIHGVENAMRRTNQMAADYKGMVAEAEGLADAGSSVIDTMASTIGSLGIK